MPFHKQLRRWFDVVLKDDGICKHCHGKDDRKRPDEPFFYSKENHLDFGDVPDFLPALHGLPRGRYCDCDKSMTSYPHWPPTCQSEAVDQLHCLVGQSHPHRQYLAHTWMAFLLGKATDGTEDDIKIISLVRNSCPVLLQSENDTPKRRRGKFDCEGICRPVLEANNSHCLCACFCHRDCRGDGYHVSEADTFH